MSGKMKEWATEVAMPVGAMVSIGILEHEAMNKGINGHAFITAIAAIAGLGGYSLGRLLTKRGK